MVSFLMLSPTSFITQCIAIRAGREASSPSRHARICSGTLADNGHEFVAKAVQEWISSVGAKTAYIEPGSPWENGFIQNFNARLRDGLLNGEIFHTLREAQIVIERLEAPP